MLMDMLLGQFRLSILVPVRLGSNRDWTVQELAGCFPAPESKVVPDATRRRHKDSCQAFGSVCRFSSLRRGRHDLQGWKGRHCAALLARAKKPRLRARESHEISASQANRQREAHEAATIPNGLRRVCWPGSSLHTQSCRSQNGQGLADEPDATLISMYVGCRCGLSHFSTGDASSEGGLGCAGRTRIQCGCRSRLTLQ